VGGGAAASRFAAALLASRAVVLECRHVTQDKVVMGGFINGPDPA